MFSLWRQRDSISIVSDAFHAFSDTWAPSRLDLAADLMRPTCLCRCQHVSCNRATSSFLFGIRASHERHVPYASCNSLVRQQSRCGGDVPRFMMFLRCLTCFRHVGEDPTRSRRRFDAPGASVAPPLPSQFLIRILGSGNHYDAPNMLCRRQDWGLIA